MFSTGLFDTKLCGKSYSFVLREKGRDLTLPYDKRDNIKNATKNFDYTTIADRLRTVSWSNRSYPTGVVKPVYERSTFPLTANVV